MVSTFVQDHDILITNMRPNCYQSQPINAMYSASYSLNLSNLGSVFKNKTIGNMCHSSYMGLGGLIRVLWTCQPQQFFVDIQYYILYQYQQLCTTNSSAPHPICKCWLHFIFLSYIMFCSNQYHLNIGCCCWAIDFLFNSSYRKVQYKYEYCGQISKEKMTQPSQSYFIIWKG